MIKTLRLASVFIVEVLFADYMPTLSVVAAINLGFLVSQPDTMLSSMRKEVERLYCKPDELGSRPLAENWCFLDSKFKSVCKCDFSLWYTVATSSTTHEDRLYCIQPDQEETMSVRDMLSDGILVLEIFKEEKPNEEDLAPTTRKRTQTLPTNTSNSSLHSQR